LQHLNRSIKHIQFDRYTSKSLLHPTDPKISQKIYSQRPEMCYLDETYHAPCGHWGPRRNVSPCAIGHTAPSFLTKGCWHAEVQGCSRINSLCAACKYQDSSIFADNAIQDPSFPLSPSQTTQGQARLRIDVQPQIQSQVQGQGHDSPISPRDVSANLQNPSPEYPLPDRIWLQRRLGLHDGELDAELLAMENRFRERRDRVQQLGAQDRAQQVREAVARWGGDGARWSVDRNRRGSTRTI
jgi:hypothetical protein